MNNKKPVSIGFHKKTEGLLVGSGVPSNHVLAIEGAIKSIYASTGGQHDFDNPDHRAVMAQELQRFVEIMEGKKITHENALRNVDSFVRIVHEKKIDTKLYELPPQREFKAVDPKDLFDGDRGK